jgi:GntR family transcriptional regulator, transcriptional repressor for pyruvate dehydrogenase complex
VNARPQDPQPGNVSPGNGPAGNAPAGAVPRQSGRAVRRRNGTTPSFATLEKTSIGLQAADAIKALIVSGELKPGDTLPPERELATMLGISRPTLREAIRVLSALNVVEPRHGGGTYVTSLDPRQLAQPISFLLQVDKMAFRHLLEVRQVLEVGAARIAAPKITDAQLALLAELTERADRLMSRPTQFLRLDFEIHTAIIEATGNPIYLSLYQSIADLSIESRKRTARDAATRQRAHLGHLAIVAALRKRDPEAAARAMHDHLDVIQDALEKSETGRNR